MAQFSKTIQNFAFQQDLWKNDSKIILAVSGGPDSMCLLNFFHELAQKYDISLHVAHVNYGLRGSESEKDADLVSKTCKKLEIPLSILNVKNYAKKGNLEDNLRNLRYEYFEKLRKELKFDLTAVAHSQDDQAETVLMRVMRGAGLNGLAAMRPKSGRIVRPFLKTSRKDIISYAKEKKLSYHIDKTNRDQKFTRNKVRHTLIPYLEKNFNPAVKKTLSELSFSIANDYSYICQEAERFRFIACTNKRISFSAEKFLKKHLALQNQILKRSFLLLSVDLHGTESANIEEFVKVIKSDKGKIKVSSFKGLNISKKGDTVEIFRIN